MKKDVWSKREYIAVKVMVSIMNHKENAYSRPEWVATKALAVTDALMRKLKDKKEKELIK